MSDSGASALSAPPRCAVCLGEVRVDQTGASHYWCPRCAKSVATSMTLHRTDYSSIEIVLSGKVLDRLDDLVRGGLSGRDRADCAERLICEALIARDASLGPRP